MKINVTDIMTSTLTTNNQYTKFRKHYYIERFMYMNHKNITKHHNEKLH